MKASIYQLFFFIIAPSLLFGQQPFSEKKMKSKVSTAKVFISGAELVRNGTVYVNKGKYRIIFTQLSTEIDGNSIQVKGKGDFTILSSKFKLKRIEKSLGSASADSLVKEIKKIDDLLLKQVYRKKVLKDKEILIVANQEMGSEQKGVTATDLNQMLVLYETQLMKIQNEYFKILKEEEKLNKRKWILQYDLDNAGSVQVTKSGEILVEIESNKSQTISLEASYYVEEAGWIPKYDIRAVSILKPLKVEYKADVYQNTGVDWKNVALTLSNGEPSKSGVKPRLKKWELNYARYTKTIKEKHFNFQGNKISGTIYDSSEGVPLPGVNVKIVGSTMGTVTDFDGNYSITIPFGATQIEVSYIGYLKQTIKIDRHKIDAYLETDLQQLEEVVVGYGGSGRSRSKTTPYQEKQKKAVKMTAELKENTTTVDFKIEKNYSLKSGIGSITVSMKDYQIPADYQYFAVPKLEKEAFLIANIPDWDQYNFLEGEANLFLEGGYVGTTIIDANSIDDTLGISLGRDKSIVINRTKVDQFTKKKTIGGNKVASREFEIDIRNKKSVPITIEFYDQIPVSVNSSILVESEKVVDGQLDASTGFIKWVEEIKKGENIKKSFKYTVKYPKNEGVILE